MCVWPARVVDLGDCAENAGGAVRPERNTVGLPNAPNGLPRLTMAVPSRVSRIRRAVEEREHPLALRVAELVELLVQYHAVYLGSVRHFTYWLCQEMMHLCRGSDKITQYVEDTRSNGYLPGNSTY